MKLRKSTFDKAADRRRFVTPAMAEPYLTKRMRDNLQRAARHANADVITIANSSQYGTANRLGRARELRDATNRLVTLEERLAAFPPPGEAARVRATHKLAAD
jgi:hypothetical protein